MFAMESVIGAMRQRGALRTGEILSMGIHAEQLRRWVAQGHVSRVSRGLYFLPGEDMGENRSLIEVCTAIPRAVACLFTALRFHRLTTQNPSEVWIALPKGQRTPHREDVQLRVVHLAEPAYTLEQERHELPRGTIRVYSLERTLVDCFRFRNTVGVDVFLEATRQAIRERRVSMEHVYELAVRYRVGNAIRPYLEAM